jgi:hypothetical protein
VPATRPTRRWNPHPGATSTCSAGAAHLRPCRRAPPAGVRPRRRPADPSDHGVGRQHRDVGPAGARAACPGVPDHRLRRARNRALATPARPAAATQPRPPGCPPPGQPRSARRPRARRVVRGRCRPGAGPAQPPPSPPAGPGLHLVRARWRPRHPAGARPARHAAALLLAPLPAGDRPLDVRPDRRPRRQAHAPAGQRPPVTTPDDVGLPEPALRDRGLDEPSVVAPHRRSSSPVARTPSSHP